MIQLNIWFEYLIPCIIADIIVFVFLKEISGLEGVTVVQDSVFLQENVIFVTYLQKFPITTATKKCIIVVSAIFYFGWFG